uniref:Uncharacterized protein n=1 Tax=Zea mays TaxID=4577 RepID=A0A804RI42_MAIZE
MDSKVCVFQLALLGVALAALAGPNIAGGIMEVGLASSRATGAAHAARQMMAQATTTMSVMELEEDEEVADGLRLADGAPDQMNRPKESPCSNYIFIFLRPSLPVMPILLVCLQ